MQRVSPLPHTNQNWPEAFGFRIGGNSPVVITSVFEDSVAQKSGLRPGDQLLEIEGTNVQNLSKEEVVTLARQSKRVPPAICVISRIRTFLLRRKRGSFGFKVRGSGPVFVSQLDDRGPAKVAGIRIGDMITEINATSVREMTFMQVEQMINTSGTHLQLVLIAGVKSIEEIEQRNTASRFRKAREFFDEMNYYLAGEEKKKSHLVKLLNKFAKDKCVETLARGLLKILETPVQKRLIGTIKQLIPREQHMLFSEILNNGPTNEDVAGKGLSRSTSYEAQLNNSLLPNSVKATSSKYRTWSKATSQAPYKEKQSHSQRQRPVSLAFDQPAEPPFVRSYSSSAAFPPRRSPEPRGKEFKSLAEEFKYQMNQFLTRGEQLVLKQRLKEYQKHRNVRELVSSLEPILDDQEKIKMVPYLSHLLPPSEQHAFDKEAQKLIAKFLQAGPSSEKRDAIDVAYRVQGLRLSESPLPKIVIGGIRESELDVIPVKDTPSSPISNESATVAALLAAAENSKITKNGGNVITTEALVHSERRDEEVSEIGNSSNLASSWDSGKTKEVRHEYQGDTNNRLQQPTTIQESAAPVEKTIIGEGKVESTKAHSDIFSAVEEQRNNLAQKDKASNDAVAHSTLLPPSGGCFVPPPPAPPPPPPPGLNLPHTGGGDTLPKMQLKRVNWEKLGVAGLENTVWGRLGRNDTLDQLDDFVELEQQFSSSKKSKATTVVKKQEKVEILEPRKQYNIAILLGHLKLPHEEIKKAVLSMDEKKLTESHVKQLLLYAPDHKEIQKYKHFADDVNKLGISDQFSLMVSQIPGYRHRLKAMYFKAHFSDKLDEIKPELETVVNASRQLRNSTKIQQVLQLVLAFGNYMNQGNARIAGASAFRVGFLAKLSSTKTSDNKSNLLKFLVKTVETKCPEVLDLKSELNSISLATRVSYQMIKEEIDDVIKSMEDVKTDLDKHGDQLLQNDDDDDKFTEIMGTFVEESKKDMNTLLELHDQMKEEYNKTAKFFGEDPSMTSTEEFFGIFSTFIDQFEHARLELVTQKKRKEEQAKREIEKQKRLKNKKGPKSSKSLDENEAENLNNDEQSTHKEMIVNHRNELQKSSSSSFENDDAFHPSGESEQLKSPPPVLPKPKKKPKIPLKSPSKTGGLASHNAAAQELALQLSQVELRNVVHKKGATSQDGGENVDTTDAAKVKQDWRIQKKPIQQQHSAFDHPSEVKKSGNYLTRQDAISDDDDDENALYSTVNFASLGFGKGAKVEPESPDDLDPYAVSNFNHFNYDPNHIGQREESTNHVFSTSKSTPVNNGGQDGRNVVQISPSLGIKEVQSAVSCGASYSVGENNDIYSLPVNNGGQNARSVVQISPSLGIKEVQSAVSGGASYSVGENNDIYSLPVNNGGQNGRSAVQISPSLGIKDVQSVVNGGTSYSVGKNNDIYSLPVNNGGQDDQSAVQISPSLGIKEDLIVLQDGTSYGVGDTDNSDIYSLPVKSTASERDLQDSYGYPEPPESSSGYGTESPYAETVPCFQNSSSEPTYETPGSIVKTSISSPTPRRKSPPAYYHPKPPNFKPPPPPPPTSIPGFEAKKKKRFPGVPKTPPQKDISASHLSHELRQKFGRRDSSSSNDESLNTKRELEPIFASRSDIGLEDSNNNNHHMVVTSPKRGAERTRDSPPLGHDDVSANHYDVSANPRGPTKFVTSNILSDIPPIVPPPPSSTPILDSDSMVAPPPPPMSDYNASYTPLAVQPPPPIYPPPRLRRAQVVVNSQKSYTSDSSKDDDDESQWLAVDDLPPPPPDFFEENPLYETVR